MGSLPGLFKMFCPNGLFICVKVEKTFFTWIKLIYPESDVGCKRGKRRYKSWKEHWTGSQETWSSLATSYVTLGKSPPLLYLCFSIIRRRGLDKMTLKSLHYSLVSNIENLSAHLNVLDENFDAAVLSNTAVASHVGY